MNIRVFTIVFGSMLVLALCLGSCKNDATPSKNETITTLKVIVQNLNPNYTFPADTFEYVNFNETKPSPPSYVDTIRLLAHTSYAIQVQLLNEDLTPYKDMTDTIIARADNHLMIYNIDPTQLFTLTILDKDSKGLPLGLMSTWATTDTTNGWLRMILRQQPGNKNGTETPGITDFEADFPVVVR